MKTKIDRKKQLIALLVSLAVFWLFVIILPGLLEGNNSTGVNDDLTQIASRTQTTNLGIEATPTNSKTNNTPVTEEKTDQVENEVESTEQSISNNKESYSPDETIETEKTIESKRHQEVNTPSQSSFVSSGPFDNEIYQYDTPEAVIEVGDKRDPASTQVSYQVESVKLAGESQSNSVLDSINNVINEPTNQNLGGIEFSLSGVAVTNSTPAENEILAKQAKGIWSDGDDDSVWNSLRNLWEVFSQPISHF